MRGVVPYLAFAAIVIGFANFGWFMVETAPMNLIPQDGFVTDGHYWLWSKTAGGYVEVSQSFYTWIRLQGLTLVVTHPMAMAGMLLLLIRSAFPARSDHREAPRSEDRAGALKSRGAPLAAMRTGATIGETHIGLPIVRVEAYPTGIVIRPAFMAPRVVLASEMVDVRYEKSWKQRGLVIRHTGTELASPVALGVDERDPIVAAIGYMWNSAGTVAPLRPAQLESSRRTSLGLPTGIEIGLNLLGFAIAGAMLAIGVVVLIPQAGVFGWIWTGWILFIGILNVRRLIRRSR
jgi:hypothetical protein